MVWHADCAILVGLAKVLTEEPPCMIETL